MHRSSPITPDQSVLESENFKGIELVEKSEPASSYFRTRAGKDSTRGPDSPRRGEGKVKAKQTPGTITKNTRRKIRSAPG
jgi:hypothetical protein